MSPIFALLAGLTVAAAVAAMTLRNLVHCALCMAVVFIGLACVYLQLNAQFVGFAQVLVYVGAVAILIVFAILLTRSSDTQSTVRVAPGWMTGLGIAAALLAVLGWVVLRSPTLTAPGEPAAELTVRDIGNALMTGYVVPLQIIGLLLTAALIGAVIIALRDQNGEKPE
jgi:NADH-quinone oxidoreductase subunit J